MKALGKLRVVSLREAVSIVVAVNGKFLSLPTIILTTRPLLALLRPQGQRKCLASDECLSRCVGLPSAPPVYSEDLRGPSTPSSSSTPLQHKIQHLPSSSGSLESRQTLEEGLTDCSFRLRHDLKAALAC